MEKCQSTKSDPCERALELYVCYKTNPIPEIMHSYGLECATKMALVPAEAIRVENRDFTNPSKNVKVSFYYICIKFKINSIIFKLFFFSSAI